MADEGSKMKAVYRIVDRGKDKKPYWLRIGTGFMNRDGSMNVTLDALPTDGKLHIRDLVPYEERGRGGDPGPSEGG